MDNGLEQWRASIGLFNSKCIIKQRVRVNDIYMLLSVLKPVDYLLEVFFETYFVY